MFFCAGKACGERMTCGRMPESGRFFCQEEQQQEERQMVQQGMGFVRQYDPEIGDPANKVAPGTPFEEIKGLYMCPVCGLGKAVFKKEE